MRSEHQAHAALVHAAQRIEWEDQHQGAWAKPTPQRRRNDPQQRMHRRVDAVLCVLLVSVVAALCMGVL